MANIWHAKPELKPGSRVRITEYVRKQHISINAPTGIVIKNEGFSVTVKRDRFRIPCKYHNTFWELDE
jgi:hypothetical protein